MGACVFLVSVYPTNQLAMSFLRFAAVFVG